MIRKHFRFRRRLFVGLAFAALAAPAAASANSLSTFVDGGPMPVSNTAVSSSTPSYLRYHEVGAPVGAGPDIRSENARSVATVNALQADGLRLTAMAQRYQQLQPSIAFSERSFGVPGPDPSLVPQLATSTSTGFDWTDAGIGASTGLAIALLAAIGIATTRRHRTGLTPA